MSDPAKALGDNMRRGNPQLSAAAIALNPHLFGAQQPAEKSAPAAPQIKQGRKMNKTEERYAAILEAMKRRGDIEDYVYEGVRLKWGVDPKTGQAMFYKPDFFVTIEESYYDDAEHRHVTWKRFKCIETKGAHIRYQDSVRYKGARAQWPQFDFEMWQWEKGEWNQIC
jgi:hypothetical protein